MLHQNGRQQIYAFVFVRLPNPSRRRGWLVRIEQSINRSLFTDKEKGRFYCQFNLDGLMRGSYKERMEGYAIGRQNGWLNANDIRGLENMNPIPQKDGGDAYLVNGNMIPISLAMQSRDTATTQKGNTDT